MFIKTSYAASYVWKIWIINCQDNLCFLYVSMENILWRVRKMWKGACNLKVDQLNLRFWAKDIPRDATALEMHFMNHLTSKLSSKIFLIFFCLYKTLQSFKCYQRNAFIVKTHFSLSGCRFIRSAYYVLLFVHYKCCFSSVNYHLQLWLGNISKWHE